MRLTFVINDDEIITNISNKRNETVSGVIKSIDSMLNYLFSSSEYINIKDINGIEHLLITKYIRYAIFSVEGSSNKEYFYNYHYVDPKARYNSVFDM